MPLGIGDPIFVPVEKFRALISANSESGPNLVHVLLCTAHCTVLKDDLDSFVPYSYIFTWFHLSEDV